MKTFLIRIGSIFVFLFGIPQLFPEILKLTLFVRLIICFLFAFIYLIAWTYSKWIGFIQKISRTLAYFLYLLIFHPYFRLLYQAIILFFTSLISGFQPLIIVLCFFSFLVSFSSLKQYPIQEYGFKKNNQKLIFEDNFSSNNGWLLNYWGTTNPSKTARIENSTIVFEALENELLDNTKEYGAYIDLKDGISEGSKYLISCSVKSEPGTTMRFQLWIHDNVIGNNSSMRTGKDPQNLEIPGTSYEEKKVEFVATATNGIRIHLHNKGGVGRISVRQVSVIQIS